MKSGCLIDIFASLAFIKYSFYCIISSSADKNFHSFFLQKKLKFLSKGEDEPVVCYTFESIRSRQTKQTKFFFTLFSPFSRENQLKHKHILSLSYFLHIYTHILGYTNQLYLTHIHIHSLPNSLSLSYTHTHTNIVSRLHTHYLSFSLSHTRNERGGR